jgi:hypothetical protein
VENFWKLSVFWTDHTGQGKAGHASVSDKSVSQIQQAFVRSPSKSVRRASCELQIPRSTVHKVLQSVLHSYAYKIQHVQAKQSVDHDVTSAEVSPPKCWSLQTVITPTSEG